MSELEPEASTELLPRARAAEPEAAAAPVFVDASGRRRRIAHRLAVGAFLTAAGYSLMVIWSLLGGPVSPDSLMPFSGPHPVTSGARPAPSAQPSAGAVIVVPSATAPAVPASTAAGASATARASATTTVASASVSASPTGRRPTSAPGKPTSSPTSGHGH